MESSRSEAVSAVTGSLWAASILVLWPLYVVFTLAYFFVVGVFVHPAMRVRRFARRHAKAWPREPIRVDAPAGPHRSSVVSIPREGRPSWGAMAAALAASYSSGQLCVAVLFTAFALPFEPESFPGPALLSACPT